MNEPLAEPKPKAKRRAHDPHPYVGILRRVDRGVESFRIRWRDPVTDEIRREAIPPHVTTKEARTDYAAAKSREIIRERQRLALGAEVHRGVPIAEAIAAYQAEVAAEKRKRTQKTYATAIARFETWANGLAGALKRGTIALTAERITALRAYVRDVPHRATGERRHPRTVNRELQDIGAMLNWWGGRNNWLPPDITGEKIATLLKPLPLADEEPVFLETPQIRALLEACRRHDALHFRETRAEHRGERPKGTTPRYGAMTPFVLFLLLSGCRRGEALRLRWSDVDTDSAHGEIRLPGAEGKTRRWRPITLSVSPALRAMLATLRPDGATDQRVFKEHSDDTVDDARARLMRDHAAPEFDYQALRRTCATFLACSSVWGAATSYRASRQLGHSKEVARDHYQSIVDQAHTATTLEAAYGCADLIGEIVNGLARKD